MAKLFGPSTIECPACKAVISTDADICPQCGEQVGNIKLLGSSTSECPCCGKTLSTDADICPGCGENVNDFKLLGATMITCPCCSERISNDASVCPHCNENLGDIKLLGSNRIECRTCGKLISSDAKVCPGCGDDLKEFKLFSTAVYCEACGRKLSKDAVRCPDCGEKIKEFSSYVAEPRRAATYSSKETTRDEGNSASDFLIRLVAYGVVIAGAIWLVIWLVSNVIIPLFFINITFISLITGLAIKKYRNVLYPLCLLGLIILTLDFSLGWFTKTIYENASFLTGFIQFLFYVNVTAGLIGIYLFIRDQKRQQLLDKFQEYSKQNFLIMGSLLLAGIIICFIPGLIARKANVASTVLSSAVQPVDTTHYQIAQPAIPAVEQITSVSKEYHGKVGKAKAYYYLNWFSNGQINGFYLYPDRPNINYQLRGTDIGNGEIILHEFTNDIQTATCNLVWRDSFYIGQMNNTDGKVLDMVIGENSIPPDSAKVVDNKILGADFLPDSITSQRHVANIRAEFQRINKADLRKVVKMLLSAKVEYYLENNVIVKIIAICDYDPRKIYGEYYFKDSKLFFTYRSFGRISENGVEGNKQEYRNYIVNDKAIKYIINRNVRPCTQCEFGENGVEYSLLRAYTTNNFAPTPCFNSNSDEVEE